MRIETTISATNERVYFLNRVRNSPSPQEKKALYGQQCSLNLSGAVVLGLHSAKGLTFFNTGNSFLSYKSCNTFPGILSG